MGPSGTGKTTLLRLITGQLRADRGSILVAGRTCAPCRGAALYVLRRRMGMLFQNGALLTDLSVFENVAFPLREHTDLPERLIRQLVLTKLQAVGLRGAAELMPAELSGGMARRVALARAIVMDPEILIYDEPFVGLDPISTGVILRLIRRLNDALGLTSIVVSHDVREISAVADRCSCCRAARSWRTARRRSCRATRRRSCGNSSAAWPTDPCHFIIRLPTISASCWRAVEDIDRDQGALEKPDRSRRGPGRDQLGFCCASSAMSPRALLRFDLIVAADLQLRRAVARHHHAVGTVRRHGAGPAGLSAPAAFRLGGGAGQLRQRSAWSRSWVRWSRRFCSPGAPARRWPRSSA